jgi:uncharacterized membrane protein (Fun14 family)
MKTPTRVVLWIVGIALLVLLYLAIDGAEHGDEYRKAEAERLHQELCKGRTDC